MATLLDILEGKAPVEEDPTEDALRDLEPGDVASARRVIEAAAAQHGGVPDVVVAILVDLFPDEPQQADVWKMIERAGWSGGPIQ
jgi:hypothetical protein